MRFVIRSADFKDREDLLELTKYFPLCSLPNNKSKLNKKIQISKKSFQQILPKKDRNYLFVLEDKKENKVIGSSQILSYFGPKQSLCYFLKKEKDHPYLNLEKMKAGRHQIGGLILHPKYRKSQDLLGLQIGLIRFLYIKTFSKAFSPIIEVSLTAPIEGRENQFWKETGRKHLKITYDFAFKTLQTNRLQFLSFFPKNLKISLNQLSLKAKSYMEQVHPQTLPVYEGLLKRGFYKTKRYHVLDGGIYLEAFWKELPFLKKTKKYLLKKGKVIKPSFFLLSQQTEQGFFCTRVKGEIKKQNLQVSRIPKEFEEGKKVLALRFPI